MKLIAMLALLFKLFKSEAQVMHVGSMREMGQNGFEASYHYHYGQD